MAYALKVITGFLLVVSMSVSANTPVQKADVKGMYVALTFDDGPGRLTPEFLDLLEREKIPATFFMIGESIELHAETVQRIIRSGHEIGNHSMSHRKLTDLPEAEICKEVEGFQLLTAQRFKYTPRLFRAPYLAHSPELWSCIESNRLCAVGASIIAYDWGGDFTEETVFRNATRNAQPGSIILLHEREQTLAALPGIIKFYRDAGYDFLTVSSLLERAGTGN